MSLISSKGIGTMTNLLAIVVSVILCVATGVYCRNRETALALAMICARSRMERLIASSRIILLMYSCRVEVILICSNRALV